MARGRGAHTVTLLSDDKVLVTGGISPDWLPLASAEILDLLTGTWSATASMAEPRAGHTATLLADGRILVAGGVNADTGILDTAEVYDPSTGSWSAAASMAEPQLGHTATRLADGRVLVISDEAPPELYNPTTGTWSPAGDGPQEEDHTATLLSDGRVLVVGGDSDGYSSAVLYNPTTDSWALAAAMPRPHAFWHTATRLQDGRVLVTGGIMVTGEYGGNEVLVELADLYDPSTDSWAPAGRMVEARGGHSVTLLADGRVLVAGGGSGVYLGLMESLTSAEVYDPSTNRWSITGSMAQWRMNHPAIQLSDGSVLVAGGEVVQEAQGLWHQYCGWYVHCPLLLAGSELYDPFSGSWLSHDPAPPEGPEGFEDVEPLDTLEPDDHGNIALTATVLNLEQEVTGTIVGLGIDFFSVEVEAGEAYAITISLDGLSDSYLTLYGTDGTSELDFNDDYGDGNASRIVWAASNTGNYYVAVEGLERGSYRVRLSAWSGPVPIPTGGILKKCVNSQAVYPLSEQHGLEAQERR